MSPTRYLKIADDATRHDVELALTLLAAKRRLCTLPETREAVGEDIDELLELWQQT